MKIYQIIFEVDGELLSREIVSDDYEIRENGLLIFFNREDGTTIRVAVFAPDKWIYVRKV